MGGRGQGRGRVWDNEGNPAGGGGGAFVLGGIPTSKLCEGSVGWCWLGWGVEAAVLGEVGGGHMDKLGLKTRSQRGADSSEDGGKTPPQAFID